MAIPQDFKEADQDLLKPEGWEDEECATLPTKAILKGGRHCNISCWELTEEEKIEVATTGMVWLMVVGGHPPLVVMGEKPNFPEWEAAEDAQTLLELEEVLAPEPEGSTETLGDAWPCSSCGKIPLHCKCFSSKG
tara:strand:+ start:8975 stop:9379 length:405 start_codon:yes stop_codon:yes gene_type:complete